MRQEAKRVLNGAHGTLYWNGLPIFECTEIEATVTINREDIQFGLSVDSKMVGVTGSGSLTIQHVYSKYKNDILNALKEGKDVRCTLSTRNTDPDATKGQVEHITINNVWFNEFPLTKFNKNEHNNETYTFGFTPTDSNIAEGIW